MTTVDERLKQIIPKIDRAKEHTAELKRQLNTFFSSNPFKVGAKRDPQTQRLIYYIVSAEPIPDVISLVVGDVIQNLRSALDHLAYQIVCNDTGEKPPKPNAIYFPIADDFTRYEAKKNNNLEGAHPDTIAAIDALKPYKGGNDTIWALHRLNNIEKHRVLLTAGSQMTGLNIGHLIAQDIKSFSPEKDLQVPKINMFLRPADTGFPLKAGSELYIGAVDEQPDPKQEFRIRIALNEPGIIDEQDILETVKQFVEEVDNIITILTSRLT